MSTYQLITGDAKDALRAFPNNHFHCIVTSPPYWNLRDYRVGGQIGNELTPQLYIENLVKVFSEAKRVLREDGVMWVVIGDTYSTPKKGNTTENARGERKEYLHNQKIDKKVVDGKTKNLLGIPWRLAFALQDNGWFLRCDVIWSKANVCPDGAKDRPTRSHEYIFMFTKSEKYFYDSFAIMETAQNVSDGDNRYFKNKRSVWETAVAKSGRGHHAVFAEKLIEPCILSSTSEYGVCPVCGSPYKRKMGMIPNNKLKTRCSREIITEGWIPTCLCNSNEPLKRCIALDPFAGLSTTGKICLKYNIEYVGVELNPDFNQKADERLSTIDPIFGKKE